MSQNVKDFNSFLGNIFPGLTNIIAEVRDINVINRILTEMLSPDISYNVTFPIGKISKKFDEIVLEETSLSLVDFATKTGYRVGLPLKIMIGRFPNHHNHNFIRIYYSQVPGGEEKKKKLFLNEGTKGESPVKLKAIDNCGWFVLYPVGSLLCDQRLRNQVKDLALEGWESALFKEFVAIDENYLMNSQSITLADYEPQDAVLWEQWMSKMDTNMFQTNVRPKNFSGSGRSEDYYLKMIIYGNKKVGAVWLEQITQRTSTAELGILIGEPHLWGLGIGGKAMSAMIDIAKNVLGLKFLWVSVRESNQRAVNCYKREGFLIVRKMPVFIKNDNSYQMWHRMEKMI